MNKRTSPCISAALLMLLAATSCSKEQVNKTLPATTTTNQSAAVNTAHFIGEHFGGGIIFYLNDNTGLHGLIADSTDLPAVQWYNGTYTITGITATAIGTGKSNTTQIVRQLGRSVKYAAIECARSKRNGFTDWYLPSRDELSQLYFKKDVIGNFVTANYYWSSSEIHDSSVFAWGVYFFSGVQYANPKNYIGNVRAIRSF